MNDYLTSKFHDMASEMMAKDYDTKDLQELQAIIGMISTLIQDGKQSELNEVLNFHFPGYYLTKAKLIHCEN